MLYYIQGKYISASALTVFRISTVNGPASVGTAVTINGTGFTSASTVNPSPFMKLIGAKTIEIGRLLTFIVNASDADGNTLTYSATDLPKNATFDAVTRLFSWTPDYSQTGSVM